MERRVLRDVNAARPRMAERRGVATIAKEIPAELIPGIHAETPASTMRVRKRDGSFEPVTVEKIIRAVERSSVGLPAVDPMRVAIKTIGGLYDGSTTKELDSLSIQTAASLIAEEPEYSRLAARLLTRFIEKEVQNQNIFSFSQSIETGFQSGLISEGTAAFVRSNARKLNSAIDNVFSDRFEFFGIRTVYDRYLGKHPETRAVLETPQYFFLRVACGLSQTVTEATAFYQLLAALEYLPSSPTLFNSGTRHSQMSSCFLLDSPEDHLESIYDRYKDVALLSKFSGGIGLAYHRVRSRGSLIQATNGHSNGIVPWLKTLDSSVSAVNQGGKRKGACCVYLESWHADIEDFLELRDNTGDEARRTYNLNLAHWVPDLFMERVEADQEWSLFDPAKVPHLPDLYGDEFRRAYLEAETAKLFERQVKARELYLRMMRTLAETGNGWMTFKDACNRKSNQTGLPQNVVHLSNLCTEITEVSSQAETAVCNLGSVNLARHVSDGAFDFEKLKGTVRSAVPFLDRVIDINFYPTSAAAASNRRWRPVGLGIMGLQDVFFQLKIAFDSAAARSLSARIQEEIYYHALEASCDLAQVSGSHQSFSETRAA
jgi:ribonucleoside-diphosphate reductase alpha chain